MKLFAGVKRSFERWLAKLAEANKQQFGSGPPDCCKINRPQPRQGNHKKH